ncbi:cytochrome c [bacterium]|nr:cytochrome c [bacterium]
MKETLFFAVTTFCFLTTPFLLAQESKSEDPGKKAYLDNKCNMCHSVSAEGIEKKTAGSKAPDLSGIGAKQNADFFVKFLKKEVDMNGKKHSKSWTGKDADLQAIAKWLESLKKPASATK